MKKEIKWARNYGVMLLILLLLLTGYSFASAARVEDFYKGKTLTFLVPNSPGGGYDTWARLLAPYISKIMGIPVVILNKVGASGLIGANYMYTEVKPDGLTIAINQAFTVVMDEFLGNRGVKYDSRKFRWLGRASYDDYAVTAGKSSPNRSFDLIKKASLVKVGIDSRTATNGAGIAAFCLSSNLENVRLIVGYAGSSEVRLALLKGEIDITSGSVGTQINLIKSGDLIPIATVGTHRAKDLPNLPTIYELNPNMPAENKKYVDILVKLTGFGRGLITAPKVPDDRYNYLVSVVKKALSDKAFIKKVNDTGFTVNYLPPADYVKELQSVILKPEEKKKLLYILQEKYPD